MLQAALNFFSISQLHRLLLDSLSRLQQTDQKEETKTLLKARAMLGAAVVASGFYYWAGQQ